MKSKSLNTKKTKVDLFVIEKVKERRLAAKMSQADLAYELGISKSFISMAESVSFPTRYNVQHINEIARILECSPQEFLPKIPL